MRRRRKQLEVSTFPFLAVLLCTMGSLIFVLLVMDRKSKLAALQKAQAEARHVAEENVRVVEERRAESRRRKEAAAAEQERQRQTLHDRLAGTDAELQERLRLLAMRLAEANETERKAQQRLAELRKQVDAERVRTIEEEQALKQDRRTAEAKAAAAAAQTEAAKKAVAEAIAEVARLESQLAELKAARAKEKQTYSVVPYRGKNGDDRRPVYVECSSVGAIFYPDRKLMAEIRENDAVAEVERIVARHSSSADPRPPYCLLLVRPDGIEPYWKLQMALRNAHIDFGYEFIDHDWVLDIPADDQTPSRSGSVVADSGPGLPAVAPPAPGTAVKGIAPVRPQMMGGPPESFPGSSERGIDRGTGRAIGFPATTGSAAFRGPEASGAGQGYGPADSRATGVPGTGVVRGIRAGGSSGPAEGGGETGVRGDGIAGIPGALGGYGPFTPGDGSGIRGSSTGPFGHGDGSNGTGTPAGGFADGSAMRGSSVGPSGHGAGSGAIGASAGGFGLGDGSGPPDPSNAWTPAVGRMSLDPAPPSGRRGVGNVDGNLDPKDVPVLADLPRAQGDGRGTGTPGDSRGGQGIAGTGQATGEPIATLGSPTDQWRRPSQTNPGTAAATGTGAGPGDGSSREPGNSGEAPQTNLTASPGAQPGTPGTGAPRGQNGQADGSPGTPGSAGLSTPADRFRTRKSDDRDPPPRRLARLGDRDWIIYLECLPNGLVLYPAQTFYSLEALSAPPQSNTLLATLRTAIDRRQATVPKGDVPYRPEIRFLMRPNSLRTLHTTYPVLESLPVPKTRQNLAADDDVRSFMQ